MFKFSKSHTITAAAALLFASTGARAFDTTAGDWKFSVNGNVNVDYIFSSCENGSTAAANGIITIGGACTGSASGSSVSNVGNGLLPAAISFGVSTTQEGYDIAAHFGFYPGIDTNDGGSPNVQQGAPAGTNVALGTTGLDVRQVYMTFGNKDIGTFTLGRNFGLFGFDAIINDMTIPGVGVAGGLSTATPANTSLGSIGFGYIYCDTIAQMNYTTVDLKGFNATIGIYDPINSLTDDLGAANGAGAGTAGTKTDPGIHGKLTYTAKFNSATKLYVSADFTDQMQKYTVGSARYSYNGFGADLNAKLDWKAFEAFASYYHAKGLGTTGLFVLSDYDGAGRTSDGYLVQGTYALGKLKLGLNYGVSRLDFANGADGSANPTLLQSNSKLTAGAYYSLTKNLTLLSEISDVDTKAHDNASNRSVNANVGAFLSF